MAEFVVTVSPAGDIRGPKGLDRAYALIERLGDRTRDTRTGEALFQTLTAGKLLLGLERVTAHICHHDEGVGNCTGLIES